jgi:hypothetical protein
MRTAWGVFLLGVGCAGAQVEEPVPYLIDEEPIGKPTDDLDALADEVQAAFDAVLGLHATPVIEGYLAAVEARDEGCPIWTGTDAGSSWFGECTTAAGARFSGYGGYFTGYDGYQDIATLYAGATVVTAEGHTFTGGGNAYLGWGENEEGPYGFSGVQGSFSWDGPGIDGTWLASGSEVGLQMYYTLATWGNAVSVNGSVVGEAGGAVYFDDVILISVGCPEEPMGLISVRGRDGWYDLGFDPQPEGGRDPATCDGCGRLWYRGDVIGEMCLDVAGIASFAEAPW